MKEPKDSSKEFLTNELKASIPSGPGMESPKTAPEVSVPDGGLSELAALENQLGAGKPGRKTIENPASPSDASGAVDSPAGTKPRRKFKVRPENTFRMALRQYWRLRDWMARRSLGLPEEYAGVFIQGKDALLVEPLIDPVIGVLEVYAPDAIIFIEEKSPLLQMFIALAEVEQGFNAGVQSVAAEIKAKKPGAETPAGAEPSRPSFPSLKETVGKTARVSA